MIHIENLSKSFKVHIKKPGLLGSISSLFRRQWIEKKALDQVSLHVNAGEIVGLLGANGAGKTTLVKALAGIIYPTSGNISVLGFCPWERKNDFRRQIALIMGQKAQLWWDLPAADCFLLLREIYEIPKLKFQENLDFLSKTLEVEAQLNIQIRRLSLGERMKMELIAALLHEPKVVFLDEPTIGLDFTAQRAIRNFILDYQKTHNPAMILTSHYMEDIKALCERIIIIREGQFIYDGPLKDIIDKYAKYKTVTVHFEQDALPFDFSHYNVIEKNAQYLKIKVAKKEVAEVVSTLLTKIPITDLVIEDEKIEDIIESLFRGDQI